MVQLWCFLMEIALQEVFYKGKDNLSSLPAYKGHASQSRTYSGYNAPADRAVDGYLQEERENTCSITLAKPEFKAAWWKFSLKRMSNIAYLEIYFRRSTVNRHVGFSVFVFNDSSYIPPSNAFQHKVFIHNTSTCLERVTTVTVNRESQGIALYNSKEPPVNTSCAGYEPAFATIEICEVKVMGCPSQHYGENCTSCDPKCRDRHCEAFNGSCIYGCSNTVIESSDCSVCKKGYYGQSCELNCGKCSIGTFCDNITGICPEGCQDHWTGFLCDACPDGFYGAACELNCGKCSNGSFCDNVTGICSQGCQDHWNGSSCDDCVAGFYGQTCENFCGNCGNGTYCNTSSGICPDGCEDQWDGLMCNGKTGFQLICKNES
ncbi:cell death abnormality protein 1-like [Saccostrea echinata]|uniref:cell death abnormality protein 1-like n=1 Tax=Saccostrea echinata TaxID=191078 RepID=UPI002A8004F4|nr:cell death abnormality protein 1-like [Saccostrea echinata]